jgi:zeta-carotene desaturase
VANSLALGTSPIVRSLFDPEGGMRDVRALDSISFTDWFKSHGGSQASIDRMWDPIGEGQHRIFLSLRGLPA